MSLVANADIFGPGREALALAHKAWGGRGGFLSVATLPADCRRVPYAFGEPVGERRERIAALVAEFASLIIPTPVGEAQGLDTIGFFADCRRAFPQAHIIADLELLGHKLGQLCLAFGADAIVGTIVDQRALRLGERAGSHELTRDEAAQLLRASGFEPCAGLPQAGARQP